MKLFSLVWKSSKRPSKQRKYRASAPLHLRKAFLVSPLSEELRKRYNTKRLSVREGDTVKIMRGEFTGATGKISALDKKGGVVYVDGVARVRKDGTKSFFPLRPSNLLLTELNIEDKRRILVLMRKSESRILKG